MQECRGDRRVRRTRRQLKESLLELLVEKPFADISVADIAERADVNRATFYLHFANAAELLQSIGDDLLDQAQALVTAHKREIVEFSTIRPVLEPVLDFTADHAELCTLLFRYEQESLFAEKLLVLIQANGAEILACWSGGRDPENTGYLVSFITWGLIGMLRSWVRGGMALPKEQLLRDAEAMTNGAVERLLG